MHVSTEASAWAERLGEALRQRRIGKLQALAAELGVDESAISRWRRGPAISIANAIRLSQTLDVSLDWLVTGRGHIDAHREAAPAVERLARELFPGLPSGRALIAARALLDLTEAVDPRA
ncbi:MAG: helix-turn-helix transcriptional regulator [Brevundimonas sp.]|uniref:helix-turn-helix domain-containing protein n=1 Tax=Brevundimonas sp. TaxID=1871086 RepID=UPI002487621D|nr:helix-turn-helix transcriptional regulator [Brevundimonas sp.]MDI1328365.1 helix-turn-helix transcriptional regulator [Brevundimonas sp.]